MNRFVKKVFADKHGKIVIFQRPNMPLMTWLALLVLAKLVHTGLIHGVASVGSFIAIIIWAGLELIQGQSLFRRILGALVLAISIISRL